MQYSHSNEHPLRLPDTELSRLAIQEFFIDIEIQAVQCLQKSRSTLCASSRLVRAPGLIHLRADFQCGIQRRHRALQDQSDVVAADLPHLGLGQGCEFASLKADAA